MDWETEQNCFDRITTECSHFHCIQNDPFLIDSQQNSTQQYDTMEERTASGRTDGRING